MDTKTFLRAAAACFSLLISTLVLPSCSDNATKVQDKQAQDKQAKEASALARAMPLSAVLQAVEANGYAPVVDVEFEKDHWQIKAYKDGQLFQLKVGLANGEIIPNPPPPAPKPLSAVIKGLEDQGYGPIVDVERGDDAEGSWEVEAYKGKSEVKIKVDPASGSIASK